MSKPGTKLIAMLRFNFYFNNNKKISVAFLSKKKALQTHAGKKKKIKKKKLTEAMEDLT